MKLAEMCDTATSYIGEIEIGRRFPSIKLIEKISEVLGVEPYRFFIHAEGLNTQKLALQGNFDTQMLAKKADCNEHELEEVITYLATQPSETRLYAIHKISAPNNATPHAGSTENDGV